MAKLTNPCINDTFYEIADPFDQNLKLTEDDILDWQDTLLTCFRKGITTVNHFMNENIPMICGNKTFERKTPETHFDLVDILLRNRSDELITKFNRDYFYYNEEVEDKTKFRPNKSYLTDWELVFVILAGYTKYWHKLYEQIQPKKAKRPEKEDALWEELKKAKITNINLYIPKNPNKNDIFFYAENNPKDITRAEDKFLMEMMFSLRMCDFNYDIFIGDMDKIWAYYLPRDYIRAKVVFNIYPFKKVPGNKSQSSKYKGKTIRNEMEQQLIQESIDQVEKSIKGWVPLQSLIEERTGYQKYWIWQEGFSKEVINFQVTDPIRFFMGEYFSEKKSALYRTSNRQREFPLWQMEKLKKKIGREEAVRYEREYHEYEIYTKMKGKLDLVLNEGFKKKLQDVRDEILPTKIT